VSHYIPRRRLGGEVVYSSYSFSISALDGMSGQCHAPAVKLRNVNQNNKCEVVIDLSCKSLSHAE
jgi:hypothetical protein